MNCAGAGRHILRVFYCMALQKKSRYLQPMSSYEGLSRSVHSMVGVCCSVSRSLVCWPGSGWVCSIWVRSRTLLGFAGGGRGWKVKRMIWLKGQRKCGEMCVFLTDCYSLQPSMLPCVCAGLSLARTSVMVMKGVSQARRRGQGAWRRSKQKDSITMLVILFQYVCYIIFFLINNIFTFI